MVTMPPSPNVGSKTPVGPSYPASAAASIEASRAVVVSASASEESEPSREEASGDSSWVASNASRAASIAGGTLESDAESGPASGIVESTEESPAGATARLEASGAWLATAESEASGHAASARGACSVAASWGGAAEGCPNRREGLRPRARRRGHRGRASARCESAGWPAPGRRRQG